MLESVADPNDARTLGIVNGTVAYMASSASQVVTGTQTGELDWAQRGGTGPASKIGSAVTLTGLAFAGETLFLTDASVGAVLRCVPPACNAPAIVAQGLLGPAEIVAAGADLFWVERDGGSVAACARDACTRRSVAAVTSPVHLAVGDRVYVSNAAGEVLAFPR